MMSVFAAILIISGTWLLFGTIILRTYQERQYDYNYCLMMTKKTYMKSFIHQLVNTGPLGIFISMVVGLSKKYIEWRDT